MYFFLKSVLLYNAFCDIKNVKLYYYKSIIKFSVEIVVAKATHCMYFYSLIPFSLLMNFDIPITGPTVRSLLCCTALGLCSTLLILTLWSSNIHIPIRSYVFHLNKHQPLLHIVSDKFLSFGLDSSLLRRMNELPVRQEKFINLARHLSPAYVRVGGTSADCLTFVHDQVVNIIH